MSSGATSILLDTNILLSKTLRDWILLPNQILNKKYFDIHTTQNILDEWGYHWLRGNPTGNDAARVKVREQIGKSVFVLEGYPISSIHGYPDKNDLHIHAAMVKHNIDYLVTNDKALLDYWETNENTGNPLPYVTISADDLLMDFVEPHLGRSTQESLILSLADLAEIYLFQERYFIKKYGEADLCGALERAEAPRFAAYLRRHILPQLP